MRRLAERLAAEYACRARHYWNLDRESAANTRFFGAAALTNEVIAHGLAQPGHSWLLCDASLERMAALSRLLAQLNGWLAARVRSMGAANGLDRRLVIHEQRCVQTTLFHWKGNDPKGVRILLAEMDRLLRYAMYASAEYPTALGVYLRVLQRLGTAAGRAPRFSQPADRVRIGEQLIAALRE